MNFFALSEPSNVLLGQIVESEGLKVLQIFGEVVTDEIFLKRSLYRSLTLLLITYGIGSSFHFTVPDEKTFFA
jgi:hypothetical protein